MAKTNPLLVLAQILQSLGQNNQKPVSPLPSIDTLNEPWKLNYVAQQQANEDAAQAYNQGIAKGTIPTPTPFPDFVINPEVANAPKKKIIPSSQSNPIQQAIQNVGQVAQNVGGAIGGAVQNIGGAIGNSWNDIVNSAKEVSREKKYPLSVMLAQTALETARGTSPMAVQKNNMVGFQAYDSNPNAAKSYKSPKESLEDYVNLIQTDPRYSSAWKQYQSDHNEYNLVQNIKKAGYASDPNYVSKVTNTPEFKQYVGHGFAPTSTPDPGPTNMPQVYQNKNLISPLSSVPSAPLHVKTNQPHPFKMTWQ